MKCPHCGKELEQFFWQATEEEKKEVLRLAESGRYTRRQIAEKTGRSYGFVYRLTACVDIKPPSKNTRWKYYVEGDPDSHPTPEYLELMRLRDQKGLTFRQIGKQFKLSQSQIAARYHRFKWHRRWRQLHPWYKE